MFNNYGDCVVFWDSDFGVVYVMMFIFWILIINVGNGIDEYFIQVMVDLYMIFKWCFKFVEVEVVFVDWICIGIVGIFLWM